MFFAKGIKAALGLGHTRGVALLASSLSGSRSMNTARSRSSRQWSDTAGQTNTGAVMVKEILNIRHALSADGADALAIALCHVNMQGPLSGLSRQLQQMKVAKMIASLRGKLMSKRPDHLIVEVEGVGYSVIVPLSTFSSLPDESSEVFLFTYMHVREDILQLFGFRTEEEKRIFMTLIGCIRHRT